MMFKYKTPSKKNVLKPGEDYSISIEVIAEEMVVEGKYKDFYELPQGYQDELIAGWLKDPNRSEPEEIFYDFLHSEALSEMMYESVSPDEIGYMMQNILRKGKHTYRIDEDLQAKCDELRSCRPRYVSDMDLLRDDDNRERAISIRRSL